MASVGQPDQWLQLVGQSNGFNWSAGSMASVGQPAQWLQLASWLNGFNWLAGSMAACFFSHEIKKHLTKFPKPGGRLEFSMVLQNVFINLAAFTQMQTKESLRLPSSWHGRCHALVFKFPAVLDQTLPNQSHNLNHAAWETIHHALGASSWVSLMNSVLFSRALPLSIISAASFTPSLRESTTLPQ